MLLLDLLLATGLPLSNIFFTVFLDEVMIITGLVGALGALHNLFEGKETGLNFFL